MADLTATAYFDDTSILAEVRESVVAFDATVKAFFSDAVEPILSGYQVVKSIVSAGVVFTFDGVLTPAFNYVLLAAFKDTSKTAPKPIPYTSITSANVEGTASFTMRASLVLNNPDSTLNAVALNVYSLWGMTGLKQFASFDYGRESIIEWCNSAMQLIYGQAYRLDYFNRETLTLQVPTSGEIALPANVQKVHGTVRCYGRNLKALPSLEDIHNFEEYHDIAKITIPIAYYMQPSRVAEGGEGVSTKLHVRPLPAAESEVEIEVCREAPRFTVHDLFRVTKLPLPHGYIETLFLPIVRKWASGDSIMSQTGRTAQSGEIDQQYQAAREMLGLADVEPESVIALSKRKPAQA